MEPNPPYNQKYTEGVQMPVPAPAFQQNAQMPPPPPYTPAADKPQYAGQPVPPYPAAGPQPQPQPHPHPQPYQPYMPYPGQPAPMPGPPQQVTIVSQQPQIQHTVIHQVGTVLLGRNSANMVCPNCHCSIRTNVSRSLKADAWICCVLLCLFGCELCIWIPFVMDSNYTTRHSCPSCHAFVGSVL